MSKDINKNIKGRAWDEMNILLDEHMPVKKNRLAWILWSMMGAFLLFFVSFLAYNYQIGTKELQPLKTNEDSKHKATESDKSEPMATFYEPAAGSKFESSQSSKIVQSQSQIIAKKLQGTSNNFTSQPSIITKVSDQNLDVNSNTNFNQQDLGQVILSSSENSKEIWIQNSNGIAKNTFQNKVTLNLPTSKSRIINLTMTKLDFPLLEMLANNTPQIKSNSKWSILAGFFTDNFQALNGGHFGFSRSTQIAKKVHFNYGLSVDAMVKSGFEDVINTSDKNEFFNISVGGDNSHSSKSITPIEQHSSYNAIANSVDQLYYANIPAYINYWLMPKLGINLGLNISYLLYGTNYSSIRSANNNFEGVDDEYLYTHRILNRLDLGVEAGLTYKLSPKFNVNLTYRHGVSQVLRKSQYYDRVDYNRTFDFSLEYIL